MPPPPNYGTQSTPGVDGGRVVKRAGFYKPGVKSFTPSRNSPFHGRLLPGYDWLMSMHDTEFKKMYVPYRGDDGGIVKLGLLAPCQIYFGNTRAKFFSPAIASNLQYRENAELQDTADPVLDMVKFIQEDETKEFHHLIERQANGHKALLSAAELRLFINAYGCPVGKGAGVVTVLDFSKSAYYDMYNKLNTLRPDGVEVWDPNYPEYLLGDVFDPQKGAMFTTKEIAVHTPTSSYNCIALSFTKENEDNPLEGIRAVPAMEHLEGRYNLWALDADNCPWVILSYQEIVDLCVDDGAFPVEMIKGACGHRAEIGATSRGPVPVANTAVRAAPAPAAKVREVPQVDKRRDEEDAFLMKQAEKDVEDSLAPPPPPRKEAAKSWYWTIVKDKDSGESIVNIVKKPLSAIQSYIDDGHAVEISINDDLWVKGNDLANYGFNPYKTKPPPPPPPVKPKVVDPDDIPPPPPRRDEPTDGFMPPSPTIRKSAPVNIPVDVPSDDPISEVDPELTPEQLDCIKRGHAVMKQYGNVRSTPDFSSDEMSTFLAYLPTHDENGCRV